jgi:hypothetical protein
VDRVDPGVLPDELEEGLSLGRGRGEVVMIAEPGRVGVEAGLRERLPADEGAVAGRAGVRAVEAEDGRLLAPGPIGRIGEILVDEGPVEKLEGLDIAGLDAGDEGR